jgi:Putative binding domain, N-terminal/Viral BACON domain
MSDLRIGPHVAIYAGVATIVAAAVAQIACGSSANTFTSPSTSSKCAVTTAASASTLPSSGGSASIAVTTERECQWTASSDGGWLKITAGGTGQGSGNVTLAADPNVDPTLRKAAVVVNDQRVEIAQAAADCRFELASTSLSVPPAGGAGSIGVRASSAQCGWTASSQVDWVAIASGASGTGSGTVSISVAPTVGLPRTGTVTVAGLSFTVNQSEGCSYAIAPSTYAAGNGGGSTQVSVSAGHDCPWSATSNALWISVAAAGGSGNGLVTVNVAPTTGPTRTGTATIAGETFTVTQSQGCAVTLTPASASAPAGGGSGRFDVGTDAQCAWSATSNAAWLTLTGAASGTGNGSVQYAVAANAGPARTAAIAVGNRSFSVTQDGGCSASLSPSSQAVASGGGTIAVAVTAASGCPWSAASNATWISIASGETGSGSGTVQVVVAANSGGDRTGTATIAGQIFTVTQAGGCTYSLSPSSAQLTAAGGSAFFAVNAADGCAWSASATVDWIAVTPPSSGTGTGGVQFAAAANAGAARVGTITVAGQTFTVNQDAACTPSIAPDTIAVPAAASSQNVQIGSAAGCAWTATSNVPWIAIASASAGTGDATVQLAITANTGPPRTGTATIASRTVTVNQDSGCTFSISPASVNMPRQGDKGSFSVDTADGCTWSARSNATWIAVTGSASGTGKGSVKFTVDRNPDGEPPRTGTIAIADQIFTVNQAAGSS